MKTVRLIFVILILVTVSRAQGNSFLRTIIGDDECRTCYFLSLEVESAEYNGRVVIENDDLFDFVRLTRKLSWDEYKEFAHELVTNNRKLDLRSYDVRVNAKTVLYIDKISENTFRIVPQIPEFEVIASRGCVEFVKEFFIESADATKSNNKRANTDCREFILDQNENLSTVRKLSALEESFVIDRLFHWQIPIVNDHYTGLTIRRSALSSILRQTRRTID